MARITLPDPQAMDPDQRRVYDKIVSGRRGRVQGPLRAALHNADLAERWQALGELLRYKTSLSPRQSELAILVTARACNSPFEWYAHRLEAEKAGIEPAIIESLLATKMPEGLSADDAAVVRFAIELNRLQVGVRRGLRRRPDPLRRANSGGAHGARRLLHDGGDDAERA